MDIGGWLRSLGLERYEAAFRENSISEKVLPRLTADDLKELGVSTVGIADCCSMQSLISDLRSGSVKPEGPLGAFATSTIKGTPAEPPMILASADTAGERRHVTVIFCDLVGSTSISAALDAEDWRDLVGGYLDAASAAVTEMGGHVAKKLGDGLIALFGYPVAQGNDAERAIPAALSIQRDLEELTRKNDGTGKPRLAARVAIKAVPSVFARVVGPRVAA
jgi:hypothetical protein